MEETPQLVSVCIVTYNSSKTILETLDSVFGQTYPRVELVVSDDCSTDDTVALCREWLDGHKSRFENTVLIAHESNGGIPKNLNSAILSASGEWLKFLAGDDLLVRDCIEMNMDFIRGHETQGIVFSRMRYFKTEGSKKVFMDYSKPDEGSLSFFSGSAEQQYQSLLRSSRFVPGATIFQSRKLSLLHLYSEAYPFCEDWPHWTHLAKNGIKLAFFDHTTVYYRLDVSLSHAPGNAFINERFHQSLLAFFYSERYPALVKQDSDLAEEQKSELFLGEVAINLFKNRRNLFTRAVLYCFKLIVGTKKVQ